MPPERDDWRMSLGRYRGPTSAHEPNPEGGYDTSATGDYPVMVPGEEPEMTGEGPLYEGSSQMILTPQEATRNQVFPNNDPQAEKAWLADVQERGNIVRWTQEGIFEVDPASRQVIQPMPQFYART